MTLVSTVGGASGPLYGTFFLRFGDALAGAELDAAQIGEALRAGLDGVVAARQGGAGDKTMVDALAPAVDALRRGRRRRVSPALAAAARGGRPRAGTRRSPMLARKGRASYLGERSIGHQDPGATVRAAAGSAAATAWLSHGRDRRGLAQPGAGAGRGRAGERDGGADNRPASRSRPGWTRTTFGTDAVAVAAAIEQVDGPDGVLCCSTSAARC